MNDWKRPLLHPLPAAVWLAWFTLVSVGAAGCTADEEKPRTRPRYETLAPEDAPKIRVHPDEDHVYRYFPTGQREPATTMAIDGVPASARETVVVIPGSGEVPAGLVYVANLTAASPDGTYPYKVVLAQELDRSLDESRGAPEGQALAATDEPAAGAGGRTPDPAAARAAPEAGDVVMYSASWCGVCSQARRWFRNKGIPIVEKDIEKIPGARAEMVERATKAGLSRSQLGGVPMIWVRGRMFPGFDPGQLSQVL